MNEQQAYAAVRNAIRLENLSRDVAAKVTPEILAIFKQLRGLIETFPPETIARDLRYRQLLLQLPGVLRGPNNQLYLGLTEALREEAGKQVEWAADYLQKGEVPPPAGVTVGPAVGQGPTALGAGAPITRTQLTALADDSKVLGKTLTQLFGWEDVADSPYMKTAIKRIDRVVKQGFLLGETNDEIARNLAQASRGLIRDTRAIARTAVMDMSQRAHNEFWDAQDRGVIQLWQFDSTLDYRVCIECAPYDGKEAKDRSDLPQVPVHPNCRCRILPVTATELELRRSGESLKQVGERSYVEISKTKPETGRVYKTKAKVNGQKVYKVARDARPVDGQALTMPQFIQRANPLTRESVLGVTRAREWEYLVNDNRGPKRKDLDGVLRDLVKANPKSLQAAQRARARRK